MLIYHPQITWYLNDRIVTPTQDLTTTRDADGVCSLRISEVYLEDGGEYCVVASNPVGKASSTARLIIDR